jgi:hypothetical protein
MAHLVNQLSRVPVVGHALPVEHLYRFERLFARLVSQEQTSLELLRLVFEAVQLLNRAKLREKCDQRFLIQ